MPRRVRDVIGSVLTIVVIILILIAIDGRVRGRMERAATELSDRGWEAPSDALSDVVADVRSTLHLESIYMMSFLGAGLLLLILMLRT